MPHKFDPKNKSKLDSEWRRSNLPPLPVLEKMGLCSDDILADIGCGIGYFTVPAAQIVNPEHSIYALDKLEEMLAETQERASAANAANIITVHTDDYDLKLPDESVTFALLVNVFHEIDNKERFLSEIRRILSKGGRIAVIDWEKEITEKGPPVEDRVAKEETASLLNLSGFPVTGTMQFAGMLYGLIAVK